MDALGKRIIEDKAQIAFLRSEAEVLERKAAKNRRDADELERLLELARRA